MANGCFNGAKQCRFIHRFAEVRRRPKTADPFRHIRFMMAGDHDNRNVRPSRRELAQVIKTVEVSLSH